MAAKPCRIALRVDASRAIGWGHLKRCLALAEALRAAGAEPLFLARRSDVDVAGLVTAAGFAFRRVDDTAAFSAGAATPTPTAHAHWLPVSPQQDAADTLAALDGWRPGWVVVDHYAIDATWHRRLRQATGARLLAIDDLADRELAVDAVLDHNPAADHRAKYRAVLKDRPAAEVAVLGGPAYALIDAVYRQHAARPFDATVRSLGLFMGGTDPGGHSLWALQACREHAGWRGLVHLATTSSNPHIAELRAAAAQDAGVQLWIDQPHLAAFHASHDLQVGAGGGALWERCALGVPTLALITAANQRLSVPWLAEAGVVVGFDALQRDEARQTELGATVARLIAAPAERAALRERSLAWVDGRGAERAAVTILALKT